MKILGLTALLALPAFSAVTTLPTAPTGYEWQLVTSGQIDSSVVDVSGVESLLEGTLGLSGAAQLPYAPGGSGSVSANLTAFGSPEPVSYSVGNTVDLVTSNNFAATLSVSNTAVVTNVNSALLLVESKINGVQITSSIGNVGPADIVQAAFANSAFVFVPPTATNVSSGGAFSQVEGETIAFAFAAADELEVQVFGGATPLDTPYTVSSTVNASLRRDTVFDTYELVETIPEPSSITLLALSALGLAARRRRA